MAQEGIKTCLGSIMEMQRSPKAKIGRSSRLPGTQATEVITDCYGWIPLTGINILAV